MEKSWGSLFVLLGISASCFIQGINVWAEDEKELIQNPAQQVQTKTLEDLALEETAKDCIDRKKVRRLVPLFKKSVCPIGHFFKISDRIYRGERPHTELHYKLLKTMGVKVIIDLEDGLSALNTTREKEVVAGNSFGLQVIRVPISPLTIRTNEGLTNLRDILKMMADSHKGPFYIHCKFGKERTGLVIALHQIMHEKKDIKRVKKEMLTLGFRRPLVPVIYFGELKRWIKNYQIQLQRGADIVDYDKIID